MDVNNFIKFIIFMLEFIKKSRFILNHKKISEKCQQFTKYSYKNYKSKSKYLRVKKGSINT